MSRKRAARIYWEMTTAELQEATKEFDDGLVADQAKPLTPALQARWQRAKARPSRRENGTAETTISVRLEKGLLDRCTALAKKKRISRDALIARSLRTLLAKEE